MKTLPGILSENVNEATKEAVKYFEIVNHDFATTNANETFKGIDDCGIVDLVRVRNGKQGVSADTDDELDSVMESLSNILIAAVLAHLRKDGKKEDSLPDYWVNGYEALISLFCCNFARNETSYYDTKVGKDVVEEVIRIGFDLNGEAVTDSMKTKINEYLSSQGKLMEKSGFGSKQTSTYSLLDFINITTSEGKHICAFKAYFTSFTPETVKIAHACKDDEKKFDFHFNVTIYQADFMLSNWDSNLDFRKRVKLFISKHTPSEDYFDECSTSTNLYFD